MGFAQLLRGSRTNPVNLAALRAGKKHKTNTVTRLNYFGGVVGFGAAGAGAVAGTAGAVAGTAGAVTGVAGRVAGADCGVVVAA
jgi:hypothetical protein